MSGDNAVGRWFRDTFHLDASGDVLVVGLGQFGVTVARTLQDLGRTVLGVDIDQADVDRFARVLGQTMRCDATDPDALKAIGADQFERAVVAIEDDVEASILATAALAQLGVPVIWSLAASEQHERILPLVGAHHVVYPDREMGVRVARLVVGKMADFVLLHDGWAVAEMTPPPTARDTPLSELNLPTRHGVVIVSVRRASGDMAIPTRHTVVTASDLLTVAGPADKVVAFSELG